MTDQTAFTARPRSEPGRPRRKRHWRRWVLASVAALVVLIVAAVGLFIKLQPSPPPLALPHSAASAPAGLADGSWNVEAGSVAGFRVPESALGFSNDVVGRTRAVTGTIVLSGDHIIRATLRVDLTAVTVSGKPQPQFATSLDTRADPVAMFTLTRAAKLGPAFISGATMRVTAVGQLSMRGVARPVTVTLSARRSGPGLQAAGSIPVAFARWGIKEPAGLGFLGSLAQHGTAEFLVFLSKS
jgi:polyisoprenoid-binding protein YceI